MTEARLPSPADWDLDWPDVLMVVGDTRGRGRVTALMHRFFITEKTAAAWLEGAHRWQRERERQAS